jgi:sugar O-acyltransferase (sialic acid O-acetyltransferase NeuD family)
MKRDLAIYGGGGLGREVLAWVRRHQDWNVIGFFDDHVAADTIVDGIRVLGGLSKINETRSELAVVLALGDPLLKARLKLQIDNPGICYPSLIHSSAIILDPDQVTIGEGSIVSAGCVLTTRIKIGAHVLLNLNCTVGHDAVIGDFSSVMPGVNIAGNVAIDEKVLIGSGANLINHISVGKESRIGMGAAVIANVAAGTTVVGVPAKPTGR